MPTDAQVLTAVLDAANAALPASVRAYTPSSVPVKRPAEFVVVTLARRAGGSARAARFATKGWAVYFMAASQTSDANARNSLRRVGEALENSTLTVGSETSTVVTFDNARPVAPDDGWFTGTDAYRFAI